MPRMSDERLAEIYANLRDHGVLSILSAGELLTELETLRSERAALVKLLRAVERDNWDRTFWEGQLLRPIDAAAKKAREVLDANQS